MGTHMSHNSRDLTCKRGVRESAIVLDEYLIRGPESSNDFSGDTQAPAECATTMTLRCRTGARNAGSGSPPVVTVTRAGVQCRNHEVGGLLNGYSIHG